ncbi:RING finger protein 223 isoform X1 [Mauremys reevesii]|uniref:RING finger protein 223 isoform X1 n=2 Tax=Mauremys reevesii TaxID=260615 RepID=UPI00193F121C|nr:RING finger protein 223 isoform X1 [Mauremys reevesii]
MESSALLLPSQIMGSGTWGSVMSCFPQMWRTEMPDSPTSPVPAAPDEIPIPMSPIIVSSPTDSRRLSSPTSSLASPKPTSPIECSICFNTYDNSFKTPKLLRCSHVFCLECVARLTSALPQPRVEDQLPCPLCRQLTEIPLEGPPALQTSQELLSTLPPEYQREKVVWMEGSKLCCRQSSQDPEDPDTCICLDVAMSKPNPPVTPTEGMAGRLSRCAMCDDWKRIVLLSALVIILLCIILWPVQCALKTGNLRCFTRTVTFTRPNPLPFTQTTPPAPGTSPPSR